MHTSLVVGAKASNEWGKCVKLGGGKMCRGQVNYYRLAWVPNAHEKRKKRQQIVPGRFGQ